MSQSPGQADLLDTIIGAGPNSAVSRLRAQRPDIVRHAQGSYDVLLFPGNPGGLSPSERALIAWHTAALSGHKALAVHYRKLADQRGDPSPGARLDTILAHVTRVTTAPGTATPAHLQALRATGLSATDVVALSQVVAFVSYQVRAAAGLALMVGEAAA
jgi:uncharacterized protein YciW